MYLQFHLGICHHYFVCHLRLWPEFCRLWQQTDLSPTLLWHQGGRFMKCLICWAKYRIHELFRLFYLYQDIMVKYIEEERLFHILTWLHPIISGIIVSVLLGANLYKSNENHTSMLMYSSCSKIPISWEEFSGMVYTKMFALSHIVVVPIGFLVQIAIFVRQRQLEKQKADGIMVIIYERDGVTISRRAPDEPSCHKLWRHDRTVVTARASFSSFLLRLVEIILNAYFFFNVSPSGPPVLGQFLITSTISIRFFLYNFIETICSPTLSNSLIDKIPFWRREYCVVNA